MQKKAAVRIYSIADGELIVKGNSLLTSARRDIVEFNARNYTEVKDFEPLELEIEAYSDLPTDEELRGIHDTATSTKNKSADNVKVKVREIMSATANVFDVHSGEYRRFGTKGMSNLSDAELIQCGKRVARTTTALLAKLAPQGITAATVTNLLTLVTTFENDINDQLDAFNDRDIATETRIVHGNSVYAKLIKLANTGKNIWVTTNEAKHNDYVFYDSPTATVVPVAPTT